MSYVSVATLNNRGLDMQLYIAETGLLLIYGNRLPLRHLLPFYNVRAV
jgi:hypothetical protein